MSWNVNGLRSIMGRGFRAWLGRSRAHLVGLQELRAQEHSVAAYARDLRGWHRTFVLSERPGYSGVGLLSKAAPDEVVTTLGDARFDSEGRFQLARFGRLTIANVYFPSGQGKNHDNSRIPHKLSFYRCLFDVLEPEKKRGARILVMGDFNTAHRDVDLARPQQNVRTSGFTSEERAELERWIRSGWTDTFRHVEPASGHYTWWSPRPGIRERNIGWRVDYVLASPAAVAFVKGAFTQPHVRGSDHCPVGVDVDDAIMRP